MTLHIMVSADPWGHLLDSQWLLLDEKVYERPPSVPSDGSEEPWDLMLERLEILEREVNGALDNLAEEVTAEVSPRELRLDHSASWCRELINLRGQSLPSAATDLHSVGQILSETISCLLDKEKSVGHLWLSHSVFDPSFRKGDARIHDVHLALHSSTLNHA